MLLLDAIQPTGVTRLQTDDGALIPALGALARTHPEAVVQVLDSVGVRDLGTVISLTGTPRVGRTAARVSITVHKSDGDETTHHTINGGALWVYRDLPSGVRATITVRARGLTIGGKRAVRLHVIGGSAGVIIDARGRPLPVPDGIRARAAALVRWYADATGDTPHELPEDWLTETRRDPDDAARARRRSASSMTNDMSRDSDAAPETAASRRGRRRKQQAAQPDVSDSTSATPNPKEDDFDDLRNLFS